MSCTTQRGKRRIYTFLLTYVIGLTAVDYTSFAESKSDHGASHMPQDIDKHVWRYHWSTVVIGWVVVAASQEPGFFHLIVWGKAEKKRLRIFGGQISSMHFDSAYGGSSSGACNYSNELVRSTIPWGLRYVCLKPAQIFSNLVCQVFS